MDAIGGQEMLMPVVHPAEIWREAGRYYSVGPELARFKDRADRDMVLAMTHEEIVADIARQDINSYRQLPQIVYHLQTKWRDEPRARAGLIRVREFTMKDSYSLDLDEDGLEISYEKHREAYHKIFGRMGLRFIVVGADVGMMGGSKSEEFMAFSPNGEDTILVCPNGDYAANREVASFVRDKTESPELLPMEEVETPNTPTIESLAKFLGIETKQTAKAVFFEGAVRQIHLRGDPGRPRHQRDEAAAPGRRDRSRPGHGRGIKAHRRGAGLRLAGRGTGCGDRRRREHPGRRELRGRREQAGLPPQERQPRPRLRGVDRGRHRGGGGGDALPGLRHADDGRARDRDRQHLQARHPATARRMGAMYLDAEGQSRPIVMGSYGIGSGRAAATVAEQSHDDKGLIWPVAVAPFHVSLLNLGTSEDAETAEAAERLYQELTNAGIEVLYDDRPDRAGVKFNDADLIGNPIRLSVSKRTLANGHAEMKARRESEATFIPLGDVVQAVREKLAALNAAEQTYS